MIRFRTEKREKLKLFDFGAFQEKLHMPSRAKYLLRKLFGAFQETSRINLDQIRIANPLVEPTKI